MARTAMEPAPGRAGSTRWPRAAPPLLDLVLAGLAAALALLSLVRADVAAVDPHLREPDLLSGIATACGAFGLAWRRSHPMRAFLVVAGGALIVSASGHYVGLLPVLLLIAIYATASRGRRRDGLIAVAVTLAGFVGLALSRVPDLRFSDLALSAAVVVASWAIGDAARSRHLQQAERLRAAEREAAAARAQATRAVAEERLRIARDMHDVVAHSMALIAIQAGVGTHVIATDRAAAERALEVIAETSRQALTQIRSLLGLLRAERDDHADARGEDGAGDDSADFPRLADLNALLSQVRASGAVVDLTVTGKRYALDPAVEAVAYRIVQESLTNVMKHARARTVQVSLDFTANRLHVDVVDDGTSAAPAVRAGPGAGHGLIGLAERARLVGGICTAGPQRSGGFRVTAELPTAPEAGTA